MAPVPPHADFPWPPNLTSPPGSRTPVPSEYSSSCSPSLAGGAWDPNTRTPEMKSPDTPTFPAFARAGNARATRESRDQMYLRQWDARGQEVFRQWNPVDVAAPRQSGMGLGIQEYANSPSYSASPSMSPEYSASSVTDSAGTQVRHSDTNRFVGYANSPSYSPAAAEGTRPDWHAGEMHSTEGYARWGRTYGVAGDEQTGGNAGASRFSTRTGTRGESSDRDADEEYIRGRHRAQRATMGLWGKLYRDEDGGMEDPERPMDDMRSLWLENEEARNKKVVRQRKADERKR